MRLEEIVRNFFNSAADFDTIYEERGYSVSLLVVSWLVVTFGEEPTPSRPHSLNISNMKTSFTKLEGDMTW